MDETGGISRATMLGIGERIKSLRFRFDRTVKEFASLLAVSPEAVEAWERGEAIEHRVINLISDKTGTSSHWLIAGLTPYQVDIIHQEAARSIVPEFGGCDRGCNTAEITETARASAESRERKFH